MVESKDNSMVYRYLGNTGLKVSLLSFGYMLASESEKDFEFYRDSVKKCYENGINFFDTAEIYGMGAAERVFGRVLKELNYPRESLVVSAKILKSSTDVNFLLSRKHIIEGLNNSLKRLQLDYVDIVFCHRPDYDTPLEETCRAMSWCIDQGKAFYWGTSMWPADRIAEAIELCDKLGLHKPTCEQAEYSMLTRPKFEKEYRRLFSEKKYGSTIWSPLAGGLLSGKYNEGEIPEDARYAILESNPQWQWIWDQYMGPKTKEKTTTILKKIGEIAKDLGYSQAQLALVWTLANTDVSTCLFGASRLEQIDSNIKALELYKKWTPELEKQITTLLGNAPEPDMDYRRYGPLPSRRAEALVKHQ